MQDQQFNNLLLGKDANWADLRKNDGKILEKLFAAQQKGATQEQKQEAREEIAKVEEPIPWETRQEIDKFITDHRRLGTRERTIRRLVKKHFKIQVV